jgi:protein pelota
MRVFINERDREIKIIPENFDDLWYAKKIIQPGDRVIGKTERSYRPPGSKRIERKVITLEIEVESIEIHRYANVLRIGGKIKEGPEEFVKINSYHTLELSPFSEIIIKKNKEINYEKEILEEAVKLSKKPTAKLIVMDERVANIATLRPSGIVFEKMIKSHISKIDANYEEKMEKYFSEIAKEIDELTIVGGNDIIIDSFKNYLKKKGISKRIYFDYVSTSERSGIYELIKRGTIKRIMKEEKISEEFEKIEEFMKELREGGLAIYGKEDIKEAIERGALAKLLIIDEESRKDPDIIEEARSKGVEITIFTSEEEPYIRLKSFGGIAGILRYRA